MAIFSSEEQSFILHAIQKAENRTSGEIRVAVERRSKKPPLERAAYYFEKANMHQTALRNGVLIYLAVDDHTFAIIGDKGINDQVPSDFWEETKQIMLNYFRQGKVAEGVAEGITQVGMQLKKLFPVAEDDINELPDDIFFGSESHDNE